MPVLNDTALCKLTGQKVVHRWFEDSKSGLVLFVDAGHRAHLVEGKALAADVTLVTEPRESIHSSTPLYSVTNLKAWLEGVTAADQRHMAWGKGTSERQSTPYREAIRYGRKVLVLQGRNNSRDLQTVGLTFETEPRAEHFFSTYAKRLPKGMVDTGPLHVAGRGAVAREYSPPSKQAGKQVNKALGRVVDQTLEWTLDHNNANFATSRQTFATADAALAALSAKELEWYRAGGRPYEIEWMERLRARADSTLIEAVEEAFSVADAASRRGFSWVDAPSSYTDPANWVAQLASDAGLPAPSPRPADAAAWRAWLRTQSAAHWLLVGQRLPKKVLSHQVMNKRGVSVHFDAEHLAVAVVTHDAARNHTWAVVKRGANPAKAKALWAATLKRFKLA